MVLFLHRRRVYRPLGGLGLGVHVGQLELGVLELGNAAAELDALLRVLNCRIRCGLSFAADLSRTLQEQLFANDFF